MRLLCISDLHGNEGSLNRILRHAAAFDMILFAGDITNFGAASDALRIVRLAEAAHKPVHAVAGNCDSPEIETAIQELGVSLHAHGFVTNGIAFQGVSGTPPWRTGMHEYAEEAIAAALDAGYAETAAAVRRVVVCHVPPHGCKADRTHYLTHIGSRALRAMVDLRQPDLLICGHVHESRGIDQLGRTVVVNCGSGNSGYYALVDIDGKSEIEVALKTV